VMLNRVSAVADQTLMGVSVTNVNQDIGISLTASSAYATDMPICVNPLQELAFLVETTLLE